MKSKNDYKNYKEFGSDMILRDHLALDRTLLANERTYLSYLRTVVSFVVAGISLWKALGGATGLLIAIILFVSAGYAAYRGNRVFKEVNKKLDLNEKPKVSRTDEVG